MSLSQNGLSWVENVGKKNNLNEVIRKIYKKNRIQKIRGRRFGEIWGPEVCKAEGSVFWKWKFVFLYSYQYLGGNFVFSLQEIMGVGSFEMSTVAFITALRHLLEDQNPEEIRDLYFLFSVLG